MSKQDETTIITVKQVKTLYNHWQGTDGDDRKRNLNKLCSMGARMARLCIAQDIELKELNEKLDNFRKLGREVA